MEQRRGSYSILIFLDKYIQSLRPVVNSNCEGGRDWVKSEEFDI